MDPLEKSLRSSKLNPLTFLGGLALAAGVFVSMGLTQLNIDFTPPPEPEPLMEFHLPPPPPPPPAKTPPKKSNVSINFNLPATTGPADVPLGFLDVDFGLNPKKLTDASLNVSDTIDNFQTDGLDDLTVYDYQDVTEKPVTTFTPNLDIPPRLIGQTKQAFSFTFICRVDTRGRATDVHILDTPYPEAIPILIQWVENTRFKPAKKDGKPVNCVVRRRITFHPSSTSSPFSL